MSTNRRKFLRAGALAAIAAAIPFKAFGQGVRKGSDGNPIDQNPKEIPSDPLWHYTRATFESYLNSIFRLYSGSITVDLALVEVMDLIPGTSNPQTGRECFSLLFRGGSVALPQNTYKLEHPALGSFSLLLVPGKPDDNGAQNYVAIINRLPYSFSLKDAPKPSPRRSGTVQPQPPVTPVKTNTPAPTTTPPRKTRPSKRGDGDEDFFERLLN